MPTTCCVPNCLERSGKSQAGKVDFEKTTFHKLPSNPRTLKEFLIRIKRDIGKHFQITTHTRICSQHYLPEDFYVYASGKRELKPDVLPSVFSFLPKKKTRKPPMERKTCTSKKSLPKSELQRGNESQSTVRREDDITLPSATPVLGPGDFDASTSSNVADQATASIDLDPQNEAAVEESVEKLREELDDLRSRFQQLHLDFLKEKQRNQVVENENKQLKYSLAEATNKLREADNELQKLSSCRLSFSSVFQNQQSLQRNASTLMKLYTGMESETEFMALYNYLNPGDFGENVLMWRGEASTNLNSSQPCVRRPRKLSGKDQLLLVFCRLRLNLHEQDLAHRFGVSQSTVSRTFASWINYLYFRLGSLQLWPSQDCIRRTMPKAFKDKYPSTRVIIDATELKCENPSTFILKSGLYSFYKSTHTFKGLLGIAPNGLVTFVSALHSGSVSDKELTRVSGILDHSFEKADSIMADKGFDISEILPPGVSLNIPPFKRNDRQFSAAEVRQTQEIASLRIHVERRISRIKSFGILSRVIPMSLAPLINQIWTVCAILTNFQTPIIKETIPDPLEEPLYMADDELDLSVSEGSSRDDSDEENGGIGH